MEIAIGLNPKHESHQVTAFYEQLAVSGHVIGLVYRSEDLLNPDEPPSLENLGVRKHLQNLVHRVIFVDKKGKTHELYSRVNNVV